MTLMNGRVDFTAEIKEFGGIDNLARTNYARNMWYIMKEFKQLPSKDGTFRTLTAIEISYILAEMEIDAKEEEAIANGKPATTDATYYDDDTSWWEHPETATLSTTDEEAEDVSRQILAMSNKQAKEAYATSLSKLNTIYSKQANADDSLSRANAVVQERISNMQAALNDYANNPAALDSYRNSLKHTVDNTEADNNSQEHRVEDSEDSLLRQLNGDE
jgi:hypothetical protein